MKKINEIYFFGNHYKIAQYLNGIAPLKQIICERKSFNRDIYDYACLHSIPFSIANDRKALELVLPVWTIKSVAISYGYGVIFKDLQIKKFTYGIWNIHPGELPGNRGRHPISWDFLNGCKRFAVSIHEIDEGIDRGNLLAAGYVLRDLKDTQNEVEEKIISALESGLIDNAIKNYFDGNKIYLDDGNYYESLAGKYNNIDPEKYNSVFLFNLFKCQSKYGGITIHGKKYTDCAFYNPDYPELYLGYDLFKTNGDRMVALR